jgi:hypothetical protein
MEAAASSLLSGLKTQALLTKLPLFKIILIKLTLLIQTFRMAEKSKS